VARRAFQLHTVLLSLARLKDSAGLKRLCGGGGGGAGGAGGGGYASAAELNLSHRARRIVDEIAELERRFLRSADTGRR
jgi:hypothetical protein